MSKDYSQLKMLGIKTIIHLTPEKFESTDNDFEWVHLEIKTVSKELELVLKLS